MKSIISAAVLGALCSAANASAYCNGAREDRW